MCMVTLEPALSDLLNVWKCPQRGMQLRIYWCNGGHFAHLISYLHLTWSEKIGFFFTWCRQKHPSLDLLGYGAFSCHDSREVTNQESDEKPEGHAPTNHHPGLLAQNCNHLLPNCIKSYHELSVDFIITSFISLRNEKSGRVTCHERAFCYWFGVSLGEYTFIP